MAADPYKPAVQVGVVVNAQVGLAANEELLIGANLVDFAAVVDDRGYVLGGLRLDTLRTHGVSTHSMASFEERPSELRTATDRQVRPGTTGTVTVVSFVWRTGWSSLGSSTW